jgi:hypothetical protein
MSPPANGAHIGLWVARGPSGRTPVSAKTTKKVVSRLCQCVSSSPLPIMVKDLESCREWPDQNPSAPPQNLLRSQMSPQTAEVMAQRDPRAPDGSNLIC